jgi:hypothetical protein
MICFEGEENSMGSTFSSVQIRNRGRMEPELFKAEVCGYFERMGLVPATEEDAEFSYQLVFSSKSDWVTLGFAENEFTIEEIMEDAHGLAETLGTYCIVSSVWDSDILQFDLFGGEAGDMALTGRVPWLEPPDGPPSNKGEREKWAPLLSEGATWEQLMEVLDGNYTFAEEALTRMAPLLGMDPGHVTKGSGYWEGVYGNPNVAQLHLRKTRPSSGKNIIYLHPKKAQQSRKKAASLSSAFKQVFGDELLPRGFIKMKGANNYFLRLIGDEILQIITYKNEPAESRWQKTFAVYAGVATVYRRSLDLRKPPPMNFNWMKSLCEFYGTVNPGKHGDDVWKSLYRISFDTGDEGSLANALDFALKTTKQLVLPLFDAVTDIEQCLLYLRKYGSSNRLIGDDEGFGNDNWNNDYNEGLLHVKANYRGDFTELFESREEYEETAKQLAMRGIHGHMDSYEEYRAKAFSNARVARVRLDAILDNPERREKARAELERRKAANIEILRSYGFEL